MFEKLIPYEAAYLVLQAYINYWVRYKRITKRAKIRFEQKDWHGTQADTRERSQLYREMIGDTTRTLLEFLGPERTFDRGVWREMKLNYFMEVSNLNTRNIAESFYNSVFRHAHHGIIGADEELMFVHSSGTYREFRSTMPIYHTFYLSDHLELTVRQIFGCYHFDVPWENLERDVDYVRRTLQSWLDENAMPVLPIRIELLKSIFFRNKAAYIVGRLYQMEKPIPFVLPLLHQDDGIWVDALLLEVNDVSTIFSYNRSYFLVDVDIVSETVDFLRSIMPGKSLGELYNSIGFEKHGKTVFYRDFDRHLEVTQDLFTFAPGTKGMVMTVFVLPSYNMVFKVIKDRFAPPKQTTFEEVCKKYELVSRHDRVGRMSDSYLFENLTLSRSRVHPELLEELLRDCGSKIEVGDDFVRIRHLYVEKRMIPLNVYLEYATPEQARIVIDEYGWAIKQMAAVNIFPGDMLLKNFGVTRLQRVVFYDYDEIGFITDYNFRAMPKARTEEEELSAEPFYYVGENDVFPEEFPRFLIGREDIRQLFLDLHGDLFTPEFWQDMQARQRRGEIVDVFPYRYSRRFSQKYGKRETVLKSSVGRILSKERKTD